MLRPGDHSYCHQCQITKKLESGYPKAFDNKILDRWFSTKEAADYLRISPKTLLNISSNGKVKYYKLGRRNRYLESDLARLLLGAPRGGYYEY